MEIGKCDICGCAILKRAYPEECTCSECQEEMMIEKLGNRGPFKKES